MQELDDYIDKVTSLPPAPQILPELLSLLNQDDVDSAPVVRLISLDPGLTASVLRLSNSAVFAGASSVSDLHEAVTRLGFRQVYQLVAAVVGSKTLGPAQKGYGMDQGELWHHCVSAAVAAQLLARRHGGDDNLVFTATLLHDIGKIVLAEALERQYAKVLESARDQEVALLDLEKKALGVQHAEVGGRLLARWKFPANIVSAVWFHHDPAAAQPHQELAAYVYLGNVVAYSMGHGYGHRSFAIEGHHDVFDMIGVSPDILPHMMVETFANLQLVQTLFSAR
ncbi:MAG TPA: HDOD domain-containing protein [Methylomirabilota bacterium]|nr:HDOD domain-containing protein [Methylomirabilota bacterium]